MFELLGDGLVLTVKWSSLRGSKWQFGLNKFFLFTVTAWLLWNTLRSPSKSLSVFQIQWYVNLYIPMITIKEKKVSMTCSSKKDKIIPLQVMLFNELWPCECFTSSNGCSDIVSVISIAYFLNVSELYNRM